MFWWVIEIPHEMHVSSISNSSPIHALQIQFREVKIQGYEMWSQGTCSAESKLINKYMDKAGQLASFLVIV